MANRPPKKRYMILSPDGISITPDKPYPSKQKAEQVFKAWASRFKQQGYYRDNSWNMIPLGELRDHCTLMTIQ